MFSSSQSTMFPPELIEHVFSFLREQKYYGLKAHPADVTLKACAMDPFLSSFAARYFYASLTLHNRDNNAQPNSLTTSSFSRLFSANPHIAEYVRDLRMAFGGGTPDEQFEAILPKLHRLESIGIVGHWFNPVNWDALPDGFRYAFLACIHRPSIKMVSLENISRFPLETLENSEISSLVLNTCTLFGTSQRPDPSAYHPSLESLTFDHVMFRSSFDDWAKRSAHSLRSLSFRLDTTDDTFVLQSLLPICSNSLACLRIDLVNNFWTECDHSKESLDTTADISVPFSVSLLPHLRELEISAKIRVTLSSIPHICQLLRSSPQYMTHPKLRLRIDCLDSDPSCLSTLDWSPFVRLFALSAHSIQQVILHMVIEKCRHAQKDQVLSSLFNSGDLTRLVEKKLIVFETLVTDRNVDFQFSTDRPLSASLLLH